MTQVAFAQVAAPLAKAARTAVMTMDFLFHPDAINTPGFDPQPIIDFNVLVGNQDNAVCESVHRGVSSKAFEHGVLTPKDEYVIWFTQHYRNVMA